MNLLDNTTLVKAARSFKFGQCSVADLPAFDSYPARSVITVRQRPYPIDGSPTGDIYENVLDPELGCRRQRNRGRRL